MLIGGALLYVVVVAITTSRARSEALSGAATARVRCLVFSQLAELDIPPHDALRNLWSWCPADWNKQLSRGAAA